MKTVYIVSSGRTPIGSFGGKLSRFTAIQLGTHALKGTMNKIGIDPSAIDEVFFGNVVSAGLGQAPARQVALFSGIPNNVPCTTINKVCSSGMKATILGVQSIMLGMNEVVAVGGVESMSNIPYYLTKARYGYKFGNGQVVDGLSHDGLWEVYNNFPMGNCAENTAKELKITREEQDEYSINSYKKVTEATKKGYFKDEIIPIEIPLRKGTPVLMDTDEEYLNVNFEKIPLLKPVFDKEGTVTAANASSINDGASALILASEEALTKYKLTPLARIVSFGDAAQEPLWFTTAPAKAITIALDRSDISQDQVDYWEINEAFAAVAISNQKKLNLPEESLNVFGGAVALGHPLGASGARIINTLCSVLKVKKGKIGVAGICNGGGGASAIVLENI